MLKPAIGRLPVSIFSRPEAGIGKVLSPIAQFSFSTVELRRDLKYGNRRRTQNKGFDDADFPKNPVMHPAGLSFSD